MAPNPKVAQAYRAMANLGISESQVKPVLKKLLKLYDKNWELIEEENYRALADAIFEDDEYKVPEQKKKSKKVNAIAAKMSSVFSNNQEEEMDGEEAQMHVEPARPLKRCLSFKKLRSEDNTSAEGCSRKQPQSQNKAVSSDGNGRIEARPVPSRDGIADKGKQPASPQVSLRGRRLLSERASPSIPSKEPTVGPGKFPLPNDQMPCTHALIIPKDEPIDELPDYEVPIAVIPPEPSSLRNSSMNNGITGKQEGHVTVASSQRRDEDILHSSNEEEAMSNVVIATSTSGEVKLSLSCNSSLLGPDFHMPSREKLIKMMVDKCLRSYKITDPSFSVPKLLRQICDCMLEFRTDSNDDSQEGSRTKSSVDLLKESEAHDTLSAGGSKDLHMLPHSSNGPINVIKSSPTLVSPRSPFSLAHQTGQDDAVLVSKMNRTNDFSRSDVRKEPEDPMSPNSHSLVVVPQHQLTADDIRSFHDADDLTKGEENVKISWVNESTHDFPPYFNYIPQNLVFQNAYVNVSLSRIGGEDCCSPCMGNCVLLSTPCTCANKTGGEFAYTAQGLVKEEFLEECIAISRHPQQHYFYCKDCPLERSKNDVCLEPCKGHLKRKFIKECWSKCGCGKECGNRVTQRGITCNLQVFFTSEGKGWGLRTLEDLPKGAFVCEFVGEILTTKELHERNMKCTENGKYTYPVLLDADWDSGFVKDEEALCLDAASFGNTARFINHRCFDANLVEIPVEVEGPDHYYYHLAFFTSRKIAAQEELTWDYGIDFDDHDHPVKLFQCRCGSKFCRNMKRTNRSGRSASIAR
ncbi:WIYLD domain [Sesbania bispinosa]|nr:WIYLD domain [Sesbania bispinosa]